MSSKSRKTWSPVEDQQLLVVILHMLPPGTLDHEKIAQCLGEGLTGKAIQHRIRRLKGMAAQSESQSPGGSTEPPQKQAGSQAETESPKKRKLR